MRLKSQPSGMSVSFIGVGGLRSVCVISKINVFCRRWPLFDNLFF